MDDDRRREPSAADIKAEKEARHEHSLEYGIEKARAIRARMESLKGNTASHKLDNIVTILKSLVREISRLRMMQ